MISLAILCECGLPIAPISPANAATDVPVNAVVYYDTSLMDVQLAVHVAASDADVPVQIARHGTYLVATPTAPLAAGTTYAVLAGTQRTTFTTGSASDITPPAFAGITSLAPETMAEPEQNDGSACVNCSVEYMNGQVSRLRLGYDDPPADAVLLVASVYPAGDPASAHEIALTRFAWADRMLGFTQCGPLSPQLAADTMYCARITAYDAAGNAAGAGAESCDAAVACTPMLDSSCAPADACIPQPPPQGHTPAAGCTTTSPSGWLLALLALVSRRARRR
jgi:hypothetical protein